MARPYQPLTLGQLANGALTAIQLANALSSSPPPPVPKVLPIDPMAGFADLPELNRYRLREGAFVLGRLHLDHGANYPVGVYDDRHVFLVAGTRSGKGLTQLVPNVLLWPGPVFMIDPKGEGASICALRRATEEAAKGTGTSVRSFVGQKVAVLDPLGQVTGPARAFRVKYNPLADIDMRQGGGVLSIRAAASAIVQTEAGAGAHFSETVEIILAGVIEAVKLCEPVERQTLPQCRSLMVAGSEPLLKYLKAKAVQTRAGLATEAATLLEEMGENEWGSMRTTLSRNFSWLAVPEMQDHLAPSGFSLRKAMQEGWSIFVSIPPDLISDFASWLRLMVRVALDAKIALGTNQKGPQTLCLLDEFPTLGRFKAIEQSAGYMAGYGLKLVPVIQNIGQLRELYSRNWETFLGNAGAILAFGLNDGETERYISDRLGKVWVEETTRSLNVGHSGQGVGGHSASWSESYSTGRHERPVRFANDIHALGARETGREFVIPASGRGFTVQRMSYTEFPAGTFDSPDFITAWEREHWGSVT